MITDLASLFRPGAQFPPDSEKERLERYEANRLLFEGTHEKVWDKETWSRILREDMQLYVGFVLNWTKRLTFLWADLLLGEKPNVVASTDTEKAYVADLLRRVKFWKHGYMGAIDVSRYGDCLFKARMVDGKAKLHVYSPRYWIPVINPEDGKEVLAHVLAWVLNDGKVLHVEIHEAGKVTIRNYAYKGDKVGSLIDEREEETGVDVPLVIHSPSVETSESIFGLDDYSDLTSLVQELELRVAQISRILDKHSDPNMYGPDGYVEEEDVNVYDPALSPSENIERARNSNGGHSIRSGGRYFPVPPGENPPGYLTWDGKLDATFKYLDLLMQQFYSLSETSPAVFGDLKSGLAESGSALKRLLLAPLAKVARIRARFDEACLETIRVLALLEGKTLGDVSIEWKDGLPDDEKESTEVATQRFVAGTMSLRRLLARLDGLEGDALEKELEAIAEEKTASMLGNPDDASEGNPNPGEDDGKGA